MQGTLAVSPFHPAGHPCIAEELSFKYNRDAAALLNWKAKSNKLKKKKKQLLRQITSNQELYVHYKPANNNGEKLLSVARVCL